MLTKRNHSRSLAAEGPVPPPGPVTSTGRPGSTDRPRARWSPQTRPRAGTLGGESLSPIEEQTVAKIEADHRPVKVKIPGRWFRVKVCVLCHLRWRCPRAYLAAEIRAGRRDHAGMMR